MTLSRDQAALARLLELALWVQGLGEHEFTFADVRERFPDTYRSAEQADKQWTRDKSQLERMGIRLKHRGAGRYGLDHEATRLGRVRLTDTEISLLVRVAGRIPGIPFRPIAHHIEVALRKLALAGVPLAGALRGLPAVQRARWPMTHEFLSVLKGCWSTRRKVEVVYRDPESGGDLTHVVEPCHVYFNKSVFVGESNLTGRTAFYLPLVQSMKHVDGMRHAYEIPADLAEGRLYTFDEGSAAMMNQAFPQAEDVRAGERSPIRPIQRSLAVGYLLLGALFNAGPEGLPWEEAIALSGARDREELDGVVEVLEAMTIPHLDEMYGIERTDSRIAVYLSYQEASRLALRPIEVGAVLAAAKTPEVDQAAFKALSATLLGLLQEEERLTAEAMAKSFHL